MQSVVPRLQEVSLHGHMIRGEPTVTFFLLPLQGAFLGPLDSFRCPTEGECLHSSSLSQVWPTEDLLWLLDLGLSQRVGYTVVTTHRASILGCSWSTAGLVSSVGSSHLGLLRPRDSAVWICLFAHSDGCCEEKPVEKPREEGGFILAHRLLWLITRLPASASRKRDRSVHFTVSVSGDRVYS